ncbi:MAG: DUF86 domain-containing protein [Chloroflexi bacterium]|nr:DUF86 domain-containing protein [Chloroflexota bacterium]
MSRDSSHFLADIETSLGLIVGFITGLDEDGFRDDVRTVAAVERQFQIVGDAVKQVPADIQSLAPAIPWSLLARFRDVLTHLYFRVDVRELWNAASVEAPLILADVRELRLKLENSADGPVPTP